MTTSESHPSQPDRDAQANWDALLTDGYAALARGDAQAARSCFARAQGLPAGNDTQWLELGIGLRRQGDLTEAEHALRQALVRAPDRIETLEALGDLLTHLGRTMEAAPFICQAFVLRPAEGQLPKMRATAYYILGRVDEAAAVYKAWLEAEPGNPTAAHLYAACAGTPPPARASDAYVTTMFDEFAGRFDDHLKQLDYRVPAEIADILLTLAPPGRQWRVVDGGCGTGLVGPTLAPWARRLIGIDLSLAMLEKAHARHVYHDLVHAELTAELARHPASCELLCMADTLIYFGDVAEVFKAGAASLTPGGRLVFSVESLDPNAATPYRLQPTGRYAHQTAYIKAGLAAAGLSIDLAKPITVRTELGRAVPGTLFVARCPT